MVCQLSSVWALGHWQTVRHVCKGHALGPSAQAILVQSDEHGEIVLGKFEEEWPYVGSAGMSRDTRV